MNAEAVHAPFTAKFRSAHADSFCTPAAGERSSSTRGSIAPAAAIVPTFRSARDTPPPGKEVATHMIAACGSTFAHQHSSCTTHIQLARTIHRQVAQCARRRLLHARRWRSQQLHERRDGSGGHDSDLVLGCAIRHKSHRIARMRHRTTQATARQTIRTCTDMTVSNANTSTPPTRTIPRQVPQRPRRLLPHTRRWRA